MKFCKKCNTFKQKSEFTKNTSTLDGLNYWCKSCTRQSSKQGYIKNKELRLKQVKEYRKTNKGIEVNRRSVARWVKDNPKKYVSHMALKQAIKYGFVKVLPCEVCGNTNVHAHHHDYNLPYDVKWLCPQHHKDEHARIIDHLNEKEK